MFPDAFPSGKTHGEKLVWFLLRDTLPDDVLVWFEPTLVGGYVPDFVLLAPSQGLFVLEVKDWKPERIARAEPKHFVLRGDAGEASENNPLETARKYVYACVDTLRNNKVLVNEGGSHAGKLRVPFGFGVVLTHFGAEDHAPYEPLLPRRKVFLKEDLERLREDEGALRLQLKGLFDHPFKFEPLPDEEIGRVRGALYPELVIRPRETPVPAPESTAAASAPVRPLPAGSKAEPPAQLTFASSGVLDLDQETLARSLGDGHRVLRGVAGSGKTLVLAARARLLARANPNWKILVLCFNVTLAAWLESLLGGEPRIEVRTFHKWALGLLPAGTPYPDGESADAAGDTMASMAFERATQYGLPRWDAILVDEGQDFREPWFELVLACLNPETNSLLVAADNAQDIYRRGFTWKKVGIQATGRTRVLKVNYRNAAPIARLAAGFLFSVIQQSDDPDERLVEPILSARTCDPPVIHAAADREEECRWVADRARSLVDSGVAAGQVAIVYPRQWIAGFDVVSALTGALTDTGLESIWLKKDKKGLAANQERVVVSTLHSVKGLEFDHVVVVNLDTLPSKSANVEVEAKELYVAMTRARRGLSLTHAGRSDFVTAVQTALSAGERAIQEFR